MTAHARPPWLEHYLPGLHVLAHYRSRWLRGDLVGGITVVAYLVPQVMAYAVIAGLPPVVGLWAILPPLALYAVLGSSRHLSIGPESTTALMTAAVVGPMANGDPARYAALAASLALLVGILSVLCGLLRFGLVADLLSRPVLVGYMAGIAIIMISSQLEKLTGVPVEGGEPWGSLRSFVSNIGNINMTTVWLGLGVLVFLFAVQRLWRHGPGPLLAVLIATAVVAVFGLTADGVAVVGSIDVGLPTLEFPGLSDFPALLLPALGVLLVGYTDVILTARTFAGRHDYRVDANQEFLALGAGNIGTSLVHGFPISSSASRTTIADASGARTQVCSLVALVGTILTLLFLSPLLAIFPYPALGALVVFAAIRLIDFAEFRRLASFRISELVIALAAFASVLVFGILYGILVAVGLSVADMLVRIARPHDAIQGIVPHMNGMHDIDDYPTAKTVDGLMIYRYDSPLFFANAEDFRRRALNALDVSEGDVQWFILNAEANVEVDITGLDAVESLRSELVSRGLVFGMARVKKDLLSQLESYGLVESIGEENFFPTLPTAVDAYRERTGFSD